MDMSVSTITNRLYQPFSESVINLQVTRHFSQSIHTSNTAAVCQTPDNFQFCSTKIYSKFKINDM